MKTVPSVAVTQSSSKTKKSSNKKADFAYALKSFGGYLEGTGKSAHTIKNYLCDLGSFEEYLEKGLGQKRVLLSEVTRTDLENYHEYLKASGQKSNTRRRKILTLRRLLRYLTSRNKIEIDVAQKLPAPHKIERVPQTVESEKLIETIRALKAESLIQTRNRVLLWLLAETGCQVSEASKLRFEDCQIHSNRKQGLIDLPGKAARQIPVSLELCQAILSLKTSDESTPWIFLGHNKFGSLGGPIWPRGIELLVKSYAPQLGFGDLTPRTFRHSAVVRWYKDGLTRDEIQKRLGLRTAYAFRVYDPIFKSMTEATSSDETSRAES